MQKIDFIYDFCSPNAYLVHRILPDLAAQRKIAITYVPVMLSGVFKATHNQNPFQAFSEIRQKASYITHDLHRFARRRNISFHMSPHYPLNTKLAMRAAYFASGKSWEAKYINAIFDAVWVHGQKVDEPGVLADILQENGLPLRKIRDAVDSDEIKLGLKDQTKAAVRRGVFGVPSMFVGSEMFFGKNSLANLELELSQQDEQGSDSS